MKILKLRFFLLLLLAGLGTKAPAALDYSWTGTQTIPDNDGSGLAYGFNLSDVSTAIADVSVTLNISGGFNGDLYVYLSHDDGFAVLLNRVGRTSLDEFGSSGPGFVVTFTGGTTADIHDYEILSPTYNGNGQLTGTWGADGRDVDPALALDTDERTAMLDDFNGLDPNGDWTIYFRDASPGGISTLNGWSVGVTPVPEPVNWALTVFAAAGLLAQGVRSWRRQPKDSGNQFRPD